MLRGRIIIKNWKESGYTIISTTVLAIAWRDYEKPRKSGQCFVHSSDKCLSGDTSQVNESVLSDKVIHVKHTAVCIVDVLRSLDHCYICPRSIAEISD